LAIIQYCKLKPFSIQDHKSWDVNPFFKLSSTRLFFFSSSLQLKAYSLKLLQLPAKSAIVPALSLHFAREIRISKPEIRNPAAQPPQQG
jgi:hypothetical protein